MPRTSIAIAISAVVALAAPVSHGAAVALNFAGMSLTDGQALNGFSYAPPDTMGAVGPNHVVEFINGGFAVYNKSTGALVGSKISDTTFWNNAGQSPVELTDPRIVFDPVSQRWFATQITDNQVTNNQILIARSNSADPTAGWKSTSITVSNSRFADYPTLGIDANGLYVGTNDFRSNNTFSNVSLYSIPKADLLATTPSAANLTRMDALSATTYGFTLQSAMNFNATSTREPIIAVSSSSTTQLKRATLTGTTAAGATLSGATTITVSTMSSPPEGHQPDGTQQLDTLDNRISGAVSLVNGRLFLTHAITVGTHSGVRWSIVDEATNALVQEGTISDATHDYFQPSIAVNSAGNVVLSYNRSSSTSGDFISSYASVGSFDGTSLTFDVTPLLLKAGTSNYHLFGGSGERWGDYSATWVDPSNPLVFWAFTETALSSSLWGTQITQIIVPEPTSAALVALCCAGMALRPTYRRRRLAD